jgi:hypothetical protein
MEIKTEWSFDPIYDEPSMDLIQRGLNKRISGRIDINYAKMRKHLAKHPSQKCAASMEETKTEAIVCGQNVWFLSTLACEGGLSGDFRCVVYVGPEGPVRKRRNEIRARLAKHLKHPGTKGFMIEEDLHV